MLRVAAAYIRRDFMIWASYRLAFLWQMASMIGGTLALYLIGTLIGDRLIDQLAQYGYGGDYFEYILVGFGFLQYLGAATSGFNDAIRDGQSTGTLEVILTSPHSLPTILIGSTGFYHVIGGLRLITIFGLGRIVFGLWPNINYLAVLITIAISVVCFAALGLMGSAFTLAIKRGDPVLGIYGLINAVLGGLVFPVELLPDWIEPLSVILPLTHALQGMRLSMQGESLAAIAPSWIGLAIIAAFLLPAGILLFRWGMNYAKDEGSLVQY